MTDRFPIRGVLIPADPEQPVIRRRFESLEDYQAVVDGRIDAVDVDPLGLSMYFNDEFLIRRMPFNQRATFLWWLHQPAARGSSILGGDVCVIGKPDRDGDDTHVPTLAANALLGKGHYAVHVRLPSGWYSTERDMTYLDAVVLAGVQMSQPSELVTDLRVAPTVGIDR